MTKVLLCSAVLIAVAAGGWLLFCRNPELGPNDVAARVDGAPIYLREVLAGLPDDGFRESFLQMQKLKLDRLIASRLLQNFLSAQKIEVEAARVNSTLEEAKRHPPGSSCPCCAPSFAQFLRRWWYTEEEYRRQLSNELGMKEYAGKRWREKYPTAQDLKRLIASQHASLEDEYHKVSHILFTGAAAEQRARHTWTQLKNGASFAELAAALSDDKTTAAQGGSLGCVSCFSGWSDPELTRQAFKVPCGAFGEPVRSARGWHLFYREPLTDKDIVGILKKQFRERTVEDLKVALRQKAHVEVLLR